MKNITRRDLFKLSAAALFSSSVCSPIVLVARADETKREMLWRKVLSAAVDDNGWIDYKKINRALFKELDSFLSYIAEDKPITIGSRQDHLAFWINAYNAVCIRSLIDAGIPAEVPHSKPPGKSLFTRKKYRVAGKIHSLDEIEHAIIRKEYNDNRAHAALVCGASSCPRLRSEPFRGPILDRQLDEECKSWIQNERTKKGNRKNYLDSKNGILYLSKIFEWFNQDFGTSEADLIAFVTRYSSPTDRQVLTQSKVTIKYLAYDWHINSK